MKNIVNIASKEFLDTLRDRRTLIMMIVVPILVFPLIFTLVTRLQTSILEKEQERLLLTGVINHDPGNKLIVFLEKRQDVSLIAVEDSGELERLVRRDSLQVGLVIEQDFSRNLEAMKSAGVKVYFSATKLTVKDRIDRILDVFSDQMLKERILAKDLEESFIHPVNIESVNVATPQEVLGKLAGGFLPYLFVIFCFMGAMYPAIDLFTGEKERKTLETLLTTPVSRFEILVGKMVVIVTTGIVSAMLAIFGLFIAFQFIAGMPEIITSVVAGMLTLTFVMLMLVMLLPLTIFFAGVMIPLTIYAKTFKEAQSILTPLTFLVIIPAIFGLIPGVELTVATALIPIVNISLATKEIVAGTIEMPLLLITIFSLVVYATLSVLFCVKWFGKETNILREIFGRCQRLCFPEKFLIQGF